MIGASTLIPVHILTGGLGSGKTTLLNNALKGGLGPESAVVINEFGEIALDQLFIQARSEDTVLLRNGCVCCTIRTDLVSALMQLVALRPASTPLRRILIECSGVSDPLPILQTLRSELSLSTRFRIASVICTVGVVEGIAVADRPQVLRQITAADAIVLTKRDLADREAIRVVQAAFAALNPLAQFLTQSGPELVQWLEQCEERGSEAQGGLGSLQLSASGAPRLHGVRSTVIRAASPASWPQFAVWLSRLIFVHGDRILRTKGVLFDPGRDVWIGVHGVRRFFHPPVHLELAQSPACGACLVFITEDIDPARIRRSYERLVAEVGNARGSSHGYEAASTAAFARTIMENAHSLGS